MVEISTIDPKAEISNPAAAQHHDNIAKKKKVFFGTKGDNSGRVLIK